MHLNSSYKTSTEKGSIQFNMTTMVNKFSFLLGAGGGGGGGGGYGVSTVTPLLHIKITLYMYINSLFSKYMCEVYLDLQMSVMTWQRLALSEYSFQCFSYM